MNHYERPSMYAIKVAPDTVKFIAEHFNDGVIPQVEKETTFFVFGEDQPNEIVSEDECKKRFGAEPVRVFAQLFYVE
jgi:hypothetical protein